jgi:hypothetical protein
VSVSWLGTDRIRHTGGGRRGGEEREDAESLGELHVDGWIWWTEDVVVEANVDVCADILLMALMEPKKQVDG